MLFFIFLVALVNLGLGFAVAILIAQHSPSASIDGARMSEPRGALSASSEPESEQAPDSPSVKAAPGPMREAAASPPADEATTEPGSQPVQSPELNASQASVTAIQAEVQRYDEQLAQLSDQFRDPTPQADSEWLQEHVQSLGEANEQYLHSRNEAYESFELLHRAVKKYESICEALEESMALQTTKIHETSEAIEAHSFQGDVKEGCKRMIAETGKLTDVNHQVRDALETALAGIARQDQWLQSSSPAMRTDVLTGIANRAGLEAHLVEWWSRDPHHTRQLSIALVDLDHFGKVNERHAQRVGDEILRAVAQLLSAETRGHGLVARYSGQRFALVFHDADIRAATNLIEKVRQLVELSCFRRGEEEIRITLSSGVTQVLPADTSESVLDRLETTVREAKRYGRNRTFVHDGKFPTPVVPPNLALQQRDISL